MTEITIQDLQKLLIYFSKNTYRAKDADSTVTFIYTYTYIYICIYVHIFQWINLFSL